ncbi:MAG TPA: M14 family zinc carboxypeptidase, partial [Candidatus Eremiobacteraceae bacterium]|nr:M14 family zinc carboxypeptidase [Candidatus Eremiobacteraceae bacterium]
MMKHWFIFATLFLTPLAAAQRTEEPVDLPEAGTSEAIAKATTDARFLSPWVASVPASSKVPSPEKYFGRIMGAPGELVNAEQAQAYLKAIADISPRVKYFVIGKSEEGRAIAMIAIADEAGIKNLEQLKATTSTLGDPRKVNAGAEEKLIASGRAIYYLNAGLHSDETGSTESVLELAYRLAVSEQPMIREIREKLVVLINPICNPDGRDKVTEWFYTYLKGKTDYANLRRQSPPYWSKYAFVDINRDAHQQTHETTKAVHRMFHEWHPTVVHDLHEGVPLLMSWNGTGPYNPNIDPITYSEFLEQGFHDVQAMTALGMPGVSTWNFGEAFSHLYLDSVAMNHNAIGRGYETFGNASTETMTRKIDASETTREWWRPVPPAPEFTWSARDNVNYNETGILASLDFAAKNSKELLRNFYTKSFNSWQKGLKESPYAFSIAPGQGDPTRVQEMVARLMAQRIEVHQAKSMLRLENVDIAAGSYVVRLDQPYRNYAVDLLSPQKYPKDGGEPYDDVSWNFSNNFHLEATPINDKSVLKAPLTLLKEPPKPTGGVHGTGPVFLLNDSGQESLLAARYELAKYRIDIAEKRFNVEAGPFEAGSWILPPREGLREALQKVADEFGLSFESVAAEPNVAKHGVPLPRIGVWVPWADTDSIGWIRYILDQRKVPYVYLRDEDIRAGRLLEKVDVLLYGHVDLELAEQIQGLPKKWSPMPFKKTEKTPSLGTPAESDDITGGIGYEGLGQIEKFVNDGGLLVTLGSGSTLALEGGIVRGVRRVAGGVPRSSQGGGATAAAESQNAVTRTPGAHVRVSFAQPEHPIAYGYPQRTYVFRQNFPLYDAPRKWLRMAYCTSCLDGPEDSNGIVLKWGDKNGEPLLVSGQVWG